MLIFFIEWLLNCISKPDYKWEFFFWLDFIAAISMITDIGFVMDALEDVLFGHETVAGGQAVKE